MRDYTPRMVRLLAFGMLLSLAALQGCIDSTVVFHVSPDGHGRAVVTSRLYTAGVLAFDKMFEASPRLVNPEDELPAPSEGALVQTFGAPIKLASTKIDKTSDGALRTTIVEFSDIRQVKLIFPPVFALPGKGFVGLDGLSDAPLITFAIKPHENGDRLLLVKLPDARIDPGPEPPQMTVFKTDSPEERLFKQAIQKMAVRMFVELEDVNLLRTNAPANKGNRATILDLDLDKIINNLDEAKVARAMSPGSLQEVLWQLGDMPGAVLPTEHEVFLEFEPPQAATQPPAPAAQAPPDTEIYLAPLKTTSAGIEVGAPINITNSPGYDNQPFFTPDGGSVLFTSVRGAAGSTQTDIYKYDIAGKRVMQVTSTPESEYSPTVTPSGAISVIRVELDGQNTQRLWQFSAEGRDPKVVLENVKPVGYHAWADDHTLALFVLGQPATLQLADTRTGTAKVISSDIGRSIQRIPGKPGRADISFVQRERDGQTVRLTVKQLNAATGDVTVLVQVPEGSREADTAWTPNGYLLMVHDGVLYGWTRGQTAWKEVVSLQRLSLSGVTRLAVSPKGDYIALVGSPRQAR